MGELQCRSLLKYQMVTDKNCFSACPRTATVNTSNYKTRELKAANQMYLNKLVAVSQHCTGCVSLETANLAREETDSQRLL